ncbi:HSP20-like chaperone [Mycena polygramma]|nr:HSP20-like chaperone [Mycena polygramma]KAJ7649129.1 HSP20-like chaperone [Mycena polygramma]
MPATRTAHSAPPSSAPRVQRQVSVSELRNLINAVRTGRLRVVDPPAEDTIFRPRMDVYDNPDSPNVVVTFELPGLAPADISVSVEHSSILVVRGERACRHRSSSNQSNRHPSLRNILNDTTPRPPIEPALNMKFFPFQEIRYGMFRRRLRLPEGVDTSCITASLSDGLLTVCWPRTPSQKQTTGRVVEIRR